MDFFMFFMLFFCFVLFFHLWLRCCTCQEKMIFWAWIQCFNNILKWAYLVQGVEHQCLKKTKTKITRGISAFIKVWSTEKKRKKKKKTLVLGLLMLKMERNKLWTYAKVREQHLYTCLFENCMKSVNKRTFKKTDNVLVQQKCSWAVNKPI